MDISFKCPNCDQELEVDASGAGSTIECPSCAHSISVPVPAVESPPPAGETPNAQKVERHFSVPVHDGAAPSEPLIKRAARPLEIAAKDDDKTVRIKTFKRSDCVEVGRDRFDEKVSAFLEKVGQPNIISINPISYSYVELGSHAVLADYGVTIVFKG
jgi:DNA-directed RNA polymerase subunit RPC12/RpoP